MTAFVAMLRAVNVGGTSKLPMAELKKIGEDCGFRQVRTFIASGNLLFTSDEAAETVERKVFTAIEKFFGRPVPIFVRTATEMADVVAANPFPDQPGNRVVASFMAQAPEPEHITGAKGVADEKLCAGRREIYIAYGDDMGHSKLRLPPEVVGTARNMNSVAKMAELLAEME